MLKGKWQIRYNTPNAVEMRKVKENIEMGDKNSNAKGVSPHLIEMCDKKSNIKGVSPHLIRPFCICLLYMI